MNTMVAGHDAARHVRGPHPERDPRDQGAAEPDPVHRRSAHDDRRRLGAGRAVGRGQRVQVGARARRGPHHRRDDARASTRSSSRRTRRWRAASAPCTSPSRRSRRRGTILYNLRPRLERNYSVRIKDEAIETALEMSPRYMRHLQLPDKVIGWLDTAAVKAEIGRRWEVTGARRRQRDLAGRADSRRHGVPRGDRSLPRHRGAARRRAWSASARRSTPSRAGWC